MLISTRGKKFEIFEVDEFITFLKENNYEFEKKEAIDFFVKNRVETIQLSKLPFKKAKKQKKIKPKLNEKIQKQEQPKKSKTEIFIEKSGCPEKAVEYFKRVKQEIKAFENPPQKFLEKTLYYVYLPDYKYYALVIQNEFNYFRDFNYTILDKKEGFYFDLYYIKLSILKKYFDYRKVLNINGMCFFEGFSKKVINKLPDKPLEKIDFMEKMS
jgi:hypothetical protein